MAVPTACDTAALSGGERERHAAARDAWVAAVLERSDLDEGLEFRLPPTPEMLTALADFIGFERRCCPFFTFEVRVDGGPEMVFRLTGPAGHKGVPGKPLVEPARPASQSPESAIPPVFGERYCSAVRTRSEPTSAIRLAGVTGGIFVTLALVVVGLTLMFLSMRSVMEIGGACADGGPFQPVRPCPNGVGLAMFGGIWGGIIALGAYFWLATSHRVASLLALAWPALFLSLGWNFMEYGFNSPAPGGGWEWGWIVCGVLFWAMGGIPLYLVAPMLFRSFWPSDPQGPVGLRDSIAVVRHPSLAGRSSGVTLRRAERSPLSPRAPAANTPESAEEDTADLTSRLERLAALYASGALTADEFALAKRKLLGETP